MGLFSLLFLVVGAVTFLRMASAFFEARASAHWPSVEGRLSLARVANTRDNKYYAEVSYDYDVSGRSYVGSRVRASEAHFDSRFGAERAIRGLLEGKQVTVYYNPNDPAESVLQPGAGGQEYFFLVYPVVIMVIAISVLVLLLRTKASERAGTANAQADDASGLFDPSKTARRREIAERWKHGRRLQDE